MAVLQVLKLVQETAFWSNIDKLTIKRLRFSFHIFLQNWFIKFVRRCPVMKNTNYFNNLINSCFMKEGAYIGALAALIVYFMLPIYGDNGTPATIIPTGNAISSTTGFSTYVSNLPFSMLIFFALEILGISVGIASQMVLKRL